MPDELRINVEIIGWGEVYAAWCPNCLLTTPQINMYLRIAGDGATVRWCIDGNHQIEGRDLPEG